MTLSTHVLDTARGEPATGVRVTVLRFDGGRWQQVAESSTDGDGRVGDLLADGEWAPGRWRLLFDTAAYLGPGALWPEVVVTFEVHDTRHHHVPLLLSPFGYTTYRGT